MTTLRISKQFSPSFLEVDFVISSTRRPLRYTKSTLRTDLCNRLTILVLGRDSEGNEWRHACGVEGPKAAIRANGIFDLLTDEAIPRRAFHVRTEDRYDDGKVWRRPAAGPSNRDGVQRLLYMIRIADTQANNISHEYHEPTEQEVSARVVDRSRTVDQGHLWRFPTTNLCQFRLSVWEIEKYSPDWDTLLAAYIDNGDPELPDFTELAVPNDLGTNFRKLSPLHNDTPLMLNKRYLCFRL